MKSTLLSISKTIIVSVLCMMNFASIQAQNQVYWGEGFELGATPPCTFQSNSANVIVPGVGIGYFTTTSGTWYVAGAYRTTGTSCAALGASHIRFHSSINDANQAASGIDTAYVVTPIVSAGIKELHLYRARASRGLSIYVTADTLATTSNWTHITSSAAFSGTVTCQDTTFMINSSTAKRLKIVSRRSATGGTGLDNDIDSVVLTSFFAISIPVEMVSFTGKKQGKTNELTWKTASELNNKGYQVERGNGTEEGWDVIGFVKGNGTGSTYYYNDKNLLSTSGQTSTYYRLRQIDFDGKETLSKVISISNDATTTKLKMYPSVTTGYLTLEADTKENYQVLNLVGQVILQGNATQRIDVTSLPSGTYMLKVGKEQAKFIKQ